MRLLSNIKNPLVLLLLALGVLSFLTGDLRAILVIFVMVVLGVVLRFFQEMRADNAAEKLKAMVSNTAALVRGGKEEEVSLKMFVHGDIIRLAAGDMVPADVRVLSAKDLFLNQTALPSSLKWFSPGMDRFRVRTFIKRRCIIVQSSPTIALPAGWRVTGRGRKGSARSAVSTRTFDSRTAWPRNLKRSGTCTVRSISKR